MRWPQLPDYGCIPRWPEDGYGFVHPEDRATATRFFPGERVFRRDTFDGDYYQCRYGDVRFRLRPCLWLPVSADGIDVGDEVETTGVGMTQDLFIATVGEMLFVRRKGCIMYRLRRRGAVIPSLFTAAELRLLRDKARVQPKGLVHPLPKWNGQGDRLAGVGLD